MVERYTIGAKTMTSTDETPTTPVTKVVEVYQSEEYDRDSDHSSTHVRGLRSTVSALIGRGPGRH